MKALAVLAACFGFAAAPASAFVHAAAHAAPHGVFAAPHGGSPNYHGGLDGPRGGLEGPRGEGPQRGGLSFGDRLGQFELLQGLLASGGYFPGYAPNPEPVAEPQFVPVPVPVPQAAPQMTLPKSSGPRIIYIGHEPRSANLPKVIYGVQ